MLIFLDIEFGQWRADMLVFLDIEFTTLARSDPDLISIGIAAVGVSDFYAERIDYKLYDASEVVRAEVIPLLGNTWRGLYVG